MRRLAALLSALTLAAVLSVAFAPAALADHGAGAASSASECTTGHPHNVWTGTSCVGDGSGAAVAGDEPGDVLAQVQDRVFEYGPTVIILFAGIAIFGFSLLLLAVAVRKALAKLAMLVRRA